MKTYRLADLISTASVAKVNAEAHNNPTWCDIWTSILDQIQKDFLPSGGGFDSGTTIESADAHKIVLSTLFHHMDDGGGYDGWTEHKITAKARFDGFDLTISGRDRNGIKEYISDCFYSCLSTNVTYSVDSDGNPTLDRSAEVK